MRKHIAMLTLLIRIIRFLPAKGLNMKLVLALLVLAIAGGIVPSAVAGQKARPDPIIPVRQGLGIGTTISPKLTELIKTAPWVEEK